jgi:hypothetical protein
MIFDGIDSIFARKLLAQVEARKGEVSEWITEGRGVTDYASYQRLVGHIAALGEVIGMFETVQNQLKQEEGKR